MFDSGQSSFSLLWKYAVQISYRTTEARLDEDYKKDY